MNYLQLCQRLHREMRDSGSGMTSVTNQRGRYLEMVEAIRDAWTDIQGKYDWDKSFYGAKPDTDPVEKYSRYDPQFLTQSLDIPFLPEQYQLIIVWQAMIGGAIRMNAPELLQKATYKHGELMMSLANRYVGPDFGVPQELDSAYEIEVFPSD